MTDVYNQEGRGMQKHYYQQHSSEPRVHQVVKAATAATAGGSLLVLSSLMLAGTVIALTLATPVLVLFSPVLVPAVITVFLLATGFLTSGGFGVAAATILVWMYRYVTGGHSTSADSTNQATQGWGPKGREFRGRGEHAAGRGHYATGGASETAGAYI